MKTQNLSKKLFLSHFYFLKIIFLVLFSVFFLNISFSFAEEISDPDTVSAKGKVLQVESKIVKNENYDDSELTMFNTENLREYEEKTLTIEILTGIDKGRIVKIKNQMNNSVFDIDPKVSDTVFLYGNKNKKTGEIEYYVQGFWHLDVLIICGSILVFLILLYGNRQGIRSLLSLFISLVIIFYFYVPALKNGENPLFWAIFSSFLISVLTLPLIHNFSKKAVISIIGTVIGILIATVFIKIISYFSHFNGLGAEEIRLFVANSEMKDIDTVGILFSGIIIGALGAVIDVAVSISSGLQELKEHKKDISQKELFVSGMNIGRDILGSMLNTLVFAYVGTSIGMILFVYQSGTPFSEFLNYNLVSEEILRALIGSFALTSTIPVTAFVASKLHSYK